MPLDNFGMVTPKLFRCAQPDPAGIATLKALGVTMIYKLNSDWSAKGEAEVLGGEVQYDSSISPFKPKKQALLNAADQLHTFALAQKTVALHCLHGRDRTGAVAATFRIKYESKPWHEIYDDFMTYDTLLLKEALPIVDMGIIEVLKEIYFDVLGVKV